MVWTEDLRKCEWPERGAGKSWPGQENHQCGTAPAKWCGLLSSAQRHGEGSQVGSFQVEVYPATGQKSGVWEVSELADEEVRLQMALHSQAGKDANRGG